MGTALSSSSPGCHRSWSLWVPQLSQLMARECQLSLGMAPSGQCPTSTSTASHSFISSNELGAARGPASPGWDHLSICNHLETRAAQ